MSRQGLKFPFQSPVDDETLATSIKTNRSGTPNDQGRFGRLGCIDTYSDGGTVLEGHRGIERNDEAYAVPRSLSPRKRPRPGLNIVTNLQQSSNRSLTDPEVARPVAPSRPRLTARAITATDTASSLKASNEKTAPTFVNLTDIRNVARTDGTTVHNTPFGTRIGREPPEYTAFAMTGRPWKPSTNKESVAPSEPLMEPSSREETQMNSLSPEKQIQTKSAKEISPSERTIVIGFDQGGTQSQAIPPQDADHTIARQLSQKTPVTPSILITPADDCPPWNYLSDESGLTGHKRPTSSIYSQSTTFAKPFKTADDAPPVPPIPTAHWDTNNGMSHSIVRQPRASLDSWEHEDSPTAAKDNESVASNDSEKRILNDRLNTTIVDARPQSKGWWNLISPILTRSNTLASKKTPVIEDARPPLPDTPKDQRFMTQVNEEPDETSPETPRRKGIGTGQGSTWSRWSDWERDREFADALSSAGLTPSVERSPSNPRIHVPEHSSPMSPPVVAGMAAEYFLACAHDNISPIPYFECVNHSCKEKLPLLVPRSDAISSIPSGSEREMPEVDFYKPPEPLVSASDKGVTEEPKNEEPQDAKDSRNRSNSESTIIDDESEDEPETPKGTPTPQVAAVSSRSPLLTDNPVPSSRTKEVASDPLQGNTTREAEKGSSQTPPVPSLRAPYPTEEVVTRSKSTEMPMEPSRGPPLGETESPARATSEVPSRRITRFPPYTPLPNSHQQPLSPGPLSPEAQEVLGPSNGTAMSEWPARSGPTFVTHNYYTHLPPRPNAVPVPISRDDPAESQRAGSGYLFPEEKPRETDTDPASRGKPRNREQEPKVNSPSRFLGCASPGGKKRLLIVALIGLGLLSVVIVSVLLAMTLTRNGDDTPVQIQWLNLTGFPPLPTGIATIIQPDAVEENSGCVNPSTVWSCALPIEEQSTLTSGDPDQPNFRMEIRFRNGTVANGTELTSSSASKRSMSNKALGNRFSSLHYRDLFEDDLYKPSPSPPSHAEQVFLGNTTDNITVPFSGETTPFFITFLSPIALTQTSAVLMKRGDLNDTTNSSSISGSLKKDIPDLSVDSNGTAAAADLLPNPVSQPLRLYNRGLSTEHYGFYTYFDRSIFLSSGTLNGTSSGNSSSSNQDGGVSETDAGLRCTWAQTRFLVQIWTNLGSTVSLLSALNTSATSTQTNATASSADDLSRPGSFPYPVSVTLDRHGGAYKKKMIYCYDLDGEQKPIKGSAQLVEEFRSAGGTIINPAPGGLSLTGNSNGNYTPSAGGIDGGTGGCECRWTNFQ